MGQETLLREQLPQSLTKDDLILMARNKGIPVRQSERKGVISDRIAEYLLQPEILQRYLLWSEDADFYCILKMAGIDVLKEQSESGPDQEPWGFLFTGYLFLDNEGGPLILPDDVQELIRKIWSQEMLLTHREYVWIRACLAIGTQLYGILPQGILARLLRQRVQYGIAASALPHLLEDIPEEFNPYVQNEQGIYNLEMEQLLPQLDFPADTEDYYIPSASEIEHHIFYTKEVHALLEEHSGALRTKYSHPFLNIGETMLRLCSLKSLECQEYTMADLVAMEGDPALYNEELGMLTELGKRLCTLFHKVDRKVRRICYHGFTAEEWETRKRSQRRTGVPAAPAEDEVQRPQQMAKVISLEEQRRQRERRGKK